MKKSVNLLEPFNYDKKLELLEEKKYEWKASSMKRKIKKLEELSEVCDAIRFWSEQIVEVQNDKNAKFDIVQELNAKRMAKYQRLVNILEIKYKRLKSCL